MWLHFNSQGDVRGVQRISLGLRGSVTGPSAWATERVPCSSRRLRSKGEIEVPQRVFLFALLRVGTARPRGRWKIPHS